MCDAISFRSSRCRQSGSRCAQPSWRAGSSWLGWPIESALVFGALISATDPIAVIALIKESRVTGRLSLLIEAESLFNDGAAAVLFTLILVWSAHDPASGRTRSPSSQRSPSLPAAAWPQGSASGSSRS